jgi:hypothetical protein
VHTVTIRGVNRDVPVDEANRMIRAIFEERWGQKQVVAVNTIRRSENMGEIVRKMEICHQKIE